MRKAKPSDQRPANGRVEKVKIAINSYEHVSYELPPLSVQPASKSSKSVVMYSTTWCGYCKKARAYFQANNIPYTDYDVEGSAEGKEKYDAIGGQGVPIIFVGQARMNGFSAEGFDRLYRQ